jgi:hypothetical protein
MGDLTNAVVGAKVMPNPGPSPARSPQAGAR